MGGGRFTSFIVLAGMRTGSNFLEANLNQFPDLKSYGELFNPHFVGGPKYDDVLGVTLKAREKDPEVLLDRIRAAEAGVVPGFRFFHDHDPRILAKCLDDPACAKVILSRNPLDSYVSRKIAGETGQWKLTNEKHRKSAKVAFDTAEFEAHLATTQGFLLHLQSALQASGQTAFYIHYDDLHSLEVLNGLARFIGSSHQVAALDLDLKRQNPADLREKVSNYEDMVVALAGMDFLNLSRSPNFEPRRGAGVPQFIGADAARLLYLPIRGGPVEAVQDWLARHEGGTVEGLTTGFNQKTLKAWRTDRPGNLSFAVVRHPVARAHAVFCDLIVSAERGGFRETRAAILKNYNIGVPKAGPGGADYGLDEHRKAFGQFLKFLKANLGDQTGMKVEPVWASQSAVLEGAASVALPMLVIREAELAASLAHIEGLRGLGVRAVGSTLPQDRPFRLAEVYDAEIEARCRDIYRGDYQQFGFGDWAE
ncbi:MAG: sulfotransferase domain-containing protein [Rhodobacteraceae bacterium]|nr:sulfotransferase domain-containing protein [Paracoccaceae bacterium]